MKRKDGYGFVFTLLVLGWLIGSPAETEPVPADDTVAVVPSPPDEKGGDLGSPAHDEPVRVTDDPSSFVRAIQVRNGTTSGIGSATHIGGGVYLTCRHVLGRAVTGIEIGGVPMAATWSTASGPDFAVVRATSSGAAARVNADELTDGQRLRIVGQKTGLHEGTLSPKRWQHGYRAVVCDVPTESGDSGAGVFNDSGELVGVHWGSTGNEVFFTPLSEVVGMLPPGSVVETSPGSTATEPSCDCDPCTCENCACGAVSAAKPSITIHMADFHCPPCNTVKGYDWSGFNVQWVTGGDVDAFPAFTWTDKDGTRRVLRGAHTPWQVKWSWDRTQ